ncbi:hypothetical protein SASPL_147538 [Salvia splendens]|uniref:Uncharacterized protein n=1 Tax=Salvia splendens TaxID=180675 RepID=A0A8X8WFZ9_SALSN|nr:hypothetical protein SASPL_147538 [Salvia splendens]
MEELLISPIPKEKAKKMHQHLPSYQTSFIVTTNKKVAANSALRQLLTYGAGKNGNGATEAYATGARDGAGLLFFRGGEDSVSSPSKEEDSVDSAN